MTRKNPTMIVKDTEGRDVELKVGDRVRPAGPTKGVSYGYVRAITEHPNDPRSHAKTQSVIYWPETKQTGGGWTSIDIVAMPTKTRRRNPKIQPKKLADDWPNRFEMEIKDEAARYVADLRGPWPDPVVLRERAVERLMKKFDRDADFIETEESWWDRWESAGIEKEIEAGLEYYKDEMWSALETNPALPPFDPVEVEQIREEIQRAVGAVAERHGLRVQYGETSPTEKVIPVSFKIYRRAPEQRDLFGNPSTLSRARNPRQARLASRISRGDS